MFWLFRYWCIFDDGVVSRFGEISENCVNVEVETIVIYISVKSQKVVYYPVLTFMNPIQRVFLRYLNHRITLPIPPPLLCRFTRLNNKPG